MGCRTCASQLLQPIQLLFGVIQCSAFPPRVFHDDGRNHGSNVSRLTSIPCLILHFSTGSLVIKSGNTSSRTRDGNRNQAWY
ncbi:hypothetical protein EDB85DRAFT_1957951 [Lactarius pseudohatsudake]|nr:hypothetical protein EDB85DRAFT_1957951 [Lactarius pseudohatsudake]